MEISSIYNPHEQTEKELLEGFVIREKEFKSIFSDVQNNRMKTPPQHYIIYGIRGSGKTSLLLKTFYEIKRDRKLKQWLIPVIFKEEQYNIRTLYKLWENIALYLEDDYDEFTGLFLKMEQYEEYDDYEEKCFELLQKVLNNKRKKIVLFFDNFGIFLDKLINKEHQRLREVLITCSDIRIVGASTFVDEATYDYGKPFFEFFKPINLKGLNKNETIRLLLKLDEKYKSGTIEKIMEHKPGRIEALRRLTSGIPRTIVLLYQIFVENKKGDSFNDLEVVLDKVTPLYKARMDDLPPQQQEITDIIAKSWDAISVKEIVKKAKMPSNAISSQIKQLEKNRVITKKKTSTKNNLYQITERFFNIWYLMRHSRKKEKCKVLWLVQFLEIWCTPQELMQRAKKHVETLKRGQLYDRYAYNVSEAYAQTIGSSKMQHEIIVTTRDYLKSINSEFFYEISKSDIELNEEAEDLLKSSNPESALAKLLKIEKKNKKHLFSIGVIYNLLKDLVKAEEFYRMAIDKGNFDAMNNLGNLYWDEHKDLAKVEEFYRLAIDKGNASAMFNLGNLYLQEHKDLAKAEEFYRMAIDKGNTNAMINLGNLYWDEYKDLAKVEEFYRMAIDKGNPNAMNNLGNLYRQEHKDLVKADEFYRMAIDKGNTNAMINLGNLYWDEHKDLAKADEFYRMAIDKGNPDAMFNLGNLYRQEHKDLVKAEEFYRMAIDKGNSDAMINLGILYWDEHKDLIKAEEFYHMAIDKGNINAINSLAWLYFMIKKNKSKALMYSQQAYKKQKNIYFSHTYSVILLWHNEIEKAIKVSKEFMDNEESYKQFSSDIELFILMLIAKKQYHYVLKLFKKNRFDLFDKYKPIYYALMYLMQDEFPNEIKRMGDELKETVNEIVEQINKLSQKYI